MTSRATEDRRVKNWMWISNTRHEIAASSPSGQENDAIIAVQASEARLSELNGRLDQIDQLLSEPPRRY